MEITTSRRCLRLWTPLVFGALVCLVMAPADGWARSATIARVAIQAGNAAQQSLLGEALVSVTDTGDLEVIGLQRAVPGGSTIEFYRDATRLFPTGSYETVTARPVGGFPSVAGREGVIFSPQTLQTGKVYMTIRTPNGVLILADLSMGVDANGMLISNNASNDPVRKITIVPEAGHEGETGELLLT